MILPDDPRHHNCRFNLELYRSARQGLYRRIVFGAAFASIGANSTLQLWKLKVHARAARLWVAGSGGISRHRRPSFVRLGQGDIRPLRTRPFAFIRWYPGTALLTACANDFDYEASISRQLEMQAQPSDVLICISSSGNSANIPAGLRKAKAMQLKTMITNQGASQACRPQPSYGCSQLRHCRRLSSNPDA